MGAEDSQVAAYFPADRWAVADRIAAECVAEELDVERKDDRDVVCTKPISGIKGAWLKFGVNHGNFDGQSKQRTTFTIRTSGAGLVVQARRDIGTGRKSDPWDAKGTNAALALLKRAGGTTSPNEMEPQSGEDIKTTGPMIIQAAPKKL